MSEGLFTLSATSNFSLSSPAEAVIFHKELKCLFLCLFHVSRISTQMLMHGGQPNPTGMQGFVPAKWLAATH